MTAAMVARWASSTAVRGPADHGVPQSGELTFRGVGDNRGPRSGRGRAWRQFVHAG
jgi:hypothetical protein